MGGIRLPPISVGKELRNKRVPLFHFQSLQLVASVRKIVSGVQSIFVADPGPQGVKTAPPQRAALQSAAQNSTSDSALMACERPVGSRRSSVMAVDAAFGLHGPTVGKDGRLPGR